MREKGGSDTAVEIRTRPVVDGVPSRGARDVREHSRGRRLSVRPGDACDAILKFGCEGAEDGNGLAKARDREGGRKCAPKLVNTRFEALQTGAELVFKGIWGHLFEPLRLGLECADLALYELRGLFERVTLLERLPDADDLLHREDVVVVVAVRRRLHETLLRPVDELPRRDVANARGFGTRKTQTCEDRPAVGDQACRQRL